MARHEDVGEVSVVSYCHSKARHEDIGEGARPQELEGTHVLDAVGAVLLRRSRRSMAGHRTAIAALSTAIEIFLQLRGP